MEFFLKILIFDKSINRNKLCHFGWHIDDIKCISINSFNGYFRCFVNINTHIIFRPMCFTYIAVNKTHVLMLLILIVLKIFICNKLRLR